MTDRSVLIIDDDPANRLLLGDLLEASGYAVQRAADGAEALRLAAEHSPTIILLDLVLPDTDGYAVCRELRARSADPTPRIYLMSGLDESDARRQGEAAGADGFLLKPLRLAELLERLANKA